MLWCSYECRTLPVQTSREIPSWRNSGNWLKPARELDIKQMPAMFLSNSREYSLPPSILSLAVASFHSLRRQRKQSEKPQKEGLKLCEEREKIISAPFWGPPEGPRSLQHYHQMKWTNLSCWSKMSHWLIEG